MFRSVSIHSQWPISRFLSPRCTGAGEDGQVSFPTVCQAAGYTDQLQNTAALQNNNVYMNILLFGCQNISHTIGTFSQTTWFNQNMFQLCGKFLWTIVCQGSTESFKASMTHFYIYLKGITTVDGPQKRPLSRTWAVSTCCVPVKCILYTVNCKPFLYSIQCLLK